MDSNLSGAVGGSLGFISGVLDLFNGPGGLRNHLWGIFRPSVTPPTNLIKILWIEMACTSVRHIVQHISCSTRTLWGHFRPSKASWTHVLQLGGNYHFLGEDYQFWGAISLLGARIYWGQDYHFMGGFLIRGKIINLCGILLTFGGVVINDGNCYTLPIRFETSQKRTSLVLHQSMILIINQLWMLCHQK